jgi:hypothetical protein
MKQRSGSSVRCVCLCVCAYCIGDVCASTVEEDPQVRPLQSDMKHRLKFENGPPEALRSLAEGSKNPTNFVVNEPVHRVGVFNDAEKKKA